MYEKHQMPFGCCFWCESTFDQILVHVSFDRLSVCRNKHCTCPIYLSAPAENLKQARIHISLNLDLIVLQQRFTGRYFLTSYQTYCLATRVYWERFLCLCLKHLRNEVERTLTRGDWKRKDTIHYPYFKIDRIWNEGQKWSTLFINSEKQCSASFSGPNLLICRPYYLLILDEV